MQTCPKCASYCVGMFPETKIERYLWGCTKCGYNFTTHQQSEITTLKAELEKAHEKNVKMNTKIALLETDLSDFKNRWNVACDDIRKRDEQIAELKEKAEQFLLDNALSPSEYCRKYNFQNCHVCDDIDCCDNTSPAKEKIRSLTKLARKLEWFPSEDSCEHIDHPETDDDDKHHRQCICGRFQREGHAKDCEFRILDKK